MPRKQGTAERKPRSPIVLKPCPGNKGKAHYWIIGEAGRGECKLCGATKQFKLGFDYG